MATPIPTVILVHAAATLAMTGLIWFVQVVHYPLFGQVGEVGFAAYERRHARLTSLVVGPLMLTEAAGAVGLAVLIPDQPLVWIGLALLVVIWLATFLLQVPRHRQLATGWDATAHRGLVGSNWLRTVAWTGRSVVALALVAGDWPS